MLTLFKTIPLIPTKIVYAIEIGSALLWLPLCWLMSSRIWAPGGPTFTELLAFAVAACAMVFLVQFGMRAWARVNGICFVSAQEYRPIRTATVRDQPFAIILVNALLTGLTVAVLQHSLPALLVGGLTASLLNVGHSLYQRRKAGRSLQQSAATQ